MTANAYIKAAPPPWCKYAIASPEGWRDPSTGEILISVRGGVGQYAPDAVTEVHHTQTDSVPIAETVEPKKSRTTRKKTEAVSEDAKEAVAPKKPRAKKTV